MSTRSGLESIGAIVALTACAAFIASFAFGIGRGGRTQVETPEGTTFVDPGPRAGRVEVLNASGRGGMARTVTAELRAAGFDVVYFGNAAPAHGDSTVVIVRAPDDAIARAVARELGIARIITERDSALFLDATVVLGKDWRAEQDRR